MVGILWRQDNVSLTVHDQCRERKNIGPYSLAAPLANIKGTDRRIYRG